MNDPLLTDTAVLGGMLQQIVKRDGKRASFDENKITEAVYKALQATGNGTEKTIAERVSSRVVRTLEQMFGDATIPTVEQVQDIVEKKLMEFGYFDAAKAYIIYRQHHKELRNLSADKKAVFDFARATITDFINDEDWRTRENSNSGAITFQGLNARLAGDLWNTFAFNEMYAKLDPKIKKAHETGEFHIHDLDFPVIAYCCGHSLEQLLSRGFGEVKERVQSSPAKHLRSAVSQIVNAVGTFQGEFAGAQAFSSVDTYLAPFVRVDNLSFEEVKQSMQELIYGLNIPSRWGWQTPFSNLTFDLTPPKDLSNKKVLSNLKREKVEQFLERERKDLREKYGNYFIDIKGYINERKIKLEQMFNSTYGEYQKEMDMVNRAYLELKREGDKDGRIFTFPIDTYNITRDFNWDNEISDLLFEVAGKFGIPYFQNYIGTNLDSGDVRAMCCRLNLDQRELMKRPGNMWGPGDSTGSIGVVTINMNRIGYESKNEKEFFKLVEERMNLAKESLELKRKIINARVEKGFVPYTKSYLGHFNNHFSTIGLVGMHECLINYIHKGIETEEGKEFSKKVLNFMRHKLENYQEETGNLYNLEASPAEGASHRLALLDREHYPHIYVSGNGTPYLTNSTQLPVYLDIDLFSALKHQEELQPLYTGGTIMHIFLGERISGSQAKNLVRKVAENTKLPYFSLTPVFSICENDGYISGIEEICSKCECITEVNDRIVGYIRPVSTWNNGKKQEFKDRKRFKI